MISKKEKLTTLGCMYIIPVISMVLFTLTKEIMINGEPAAWYLLSIAGFLAGMAVEGALFIFGVTFAVLAGKA